MHGSRSSRTTNVGENTAPGGKIVVSSADQGLTSRKASEVKESRPTSTLNVGVSTASGGMTVDSTAANCFSVIRCQ